MSWDRIDYRVYTKTKLTNFPGFNLHYHHKGFLHFLLNYRMSFVQL